MITAWMAYRTSCGRVISHFPVLFGHIGHGVFVTSEAGVRGSAAGMAGGTLGHRVIPVGEREGMAEGGWSPGGCGMAGFTIRASLARMRIIRRMAGVAGRGCAVEHIVDVAGDTSRAVMGAGQREG